MSEVRAEWANKQTNKQTRTAIAKSAHTVNLFSLIKWQGSHITGRTGSPLSLFWDQMYGAEGKKNEFEYYLYNILSCP